MNQDSTLYNYQTQKPNSDIHSNASRVDQDNSSKILTEISRSNEPNVLEAENFRQNSTPDDIIRSRASSQRDITDANQLLGHQLFHERQLC